MWEKLEVTYRNYLNKIGLKRLPPLALILVIPIYLIMTVLYIPAKICMWLLGFWKCHECKKTYWSNTARRAFHDGMDEYDPGEPKICEHCIIMNQITDNEEVKLIV